MLRSGASTPQIQSVQTHRRSTGLISIDTAAERINDTGGKRGGWGVRKKKNIGGEVYQGKGRKMGQKERTKTVIKGEERHKKTKENKTSG